MFVNYLIYIDCLVCPAKFYLEVVIEVHRVAFVEVSVCSFLTTLKWLTIVSMRRVSVQYFMWLVISMRS